MNPDNDIYDTTELEHEFMYGIYEDILKTEEQMAELKLIDEAEHESKKLRNINFQNFPLEQFLDAGKVANQGDPQLKAAADSELYELEKRAIEIDINANTDVNATTQINEDKIDADDYSSPDTVSHVQHKNSEKKSSEHDDNILRKTVYGPTYVPFNEEGQKILLPQSTNMSRKYNLKHLYNSQPEGMCDNRYDSLEQGTIDTETFNYSHESNTQHV